LRRSTSRTTSLGFSISRPAAATVAFKYLPRLLVHPFALFPTADSPQVPLVLMIVRWDGMLGFAGGVVEPEEACDPKDGASAVRAAAEKALRRELREELGVTEAGELEHICTHLTAANGSRSHFWAREVDVEKFIEIESGVRRGMHFGCEVMGAFRAPLFPSQLESFFRSNFPPGALAQLLIFLSKKNMIPVRDLEAAVQVRHTPPRSARFLCDFFRADHDTGLLTAALQGLGLEPSAVLFKKAS
jgi:8-oxo-dGTP pyrophosphatase MutT (NUDIX family)